MNDTTLHPLARDYLARLEALAAGLPQPEREELVAEIRSHLSAGLPPGAGEAEVRNLLADLGPPEDIVAASGPPSPSYAAPPVAPSRWGPLEVVAVVALVASPALPVLGPLAGTTCAWFSRRWTLADKVVASLLAVGPLLFVALGVYLPAMVTR